MTPELARAVARAVPPFERLDERRYRLAPNQDVSALTRRADAWIAGIGGEAEMGRHLAVLGLSWDAWRRTLGDVELVPGAAPAAWAEAGARLLACLIDVEDAGGTADDGYRALREMARRDLVSAVSSEIEIAPDATTGPLDLLASRLGAALSPTLQTEARLDSDASWPWRGRIVRSPGLVYAWGVLYANWLSALIEMLARAKADRERLARRFFGGRSPGRLIAIEPGLGDPHAGGRSVAVLAFDAGKVVYKPKNLRVTDVVEACAGEISRRTGLALEPPAVEHGDGYAWQAFVAPRPVAQAGEVGSFWRSLGGWLALLQVLGASDFWFDNLLADGAVPRFVDYETALQPALAGIPLSTAASGSRPEALGAYALSAISVGILPWQFPVAEGEDPTDLGCTARPGEHRTPMLRTNARGRVSWTEDRFVPRLPDGSFADAGDGMGDFLDGYDAALACCGDTAGGAAIERALTTAGAAPVRVIRIDTWTCYRLMQRSLAPRCLADGVWREIELRRSLADWPDLDGAVREAAVRDLRRLDVPLFQCAADGQDLVGCEGERAPAWFAASPIDHARARLAWLGRADRRAQAALVRSAFAVREGRSSPLPVRTAGPARVGAADLLDWTRQIGQMIAAEVMSDPGGAPTWLALCQDPFTGVRGVHPLGVDLLTGRSGVALALIEAGLATGTPAWTALARETLAGCAAALLKMPSLVRRIGVGVAGTGGLVYALARCGMALDDRALRNLADDLADLIGQQALWRDQGDDYAAGRSGLVACIEAADLTGEVPTRLLSVLAAADRPALGHGRRYAPSAAALLARIGGWTRGAQTAGYPEATGSLARLDALWEAGLAGNRAAGLDAAAHLAAHRAAGSWFPDHPADDRHHLSAITGLSGLAIALARMGSDRLPLGAPRRPEQGPCNKSKH